MTLQPDVVIIDSDSKNLTLATNFILDYIPSSIEAFSMDGPLGTIEINVLFKINGVSNT